MAYEAEGAIDSVEGVAGGLLGAFFVGAGRARQQAEAERQVRAARRARVAAGARAGVLQDTVASLRERLADSAADVDYLSELVRDLQAQVTDLTADRQVLADALRARRKA